MYQIPAPEGHIETASWELLTGWVWFPAEPGRRADIEILHGGVLICKLKADVYRSDIEKAGFGDGRYGFDVSLPKQAFTELDVVFDVREASSGVHLRGSPFVLQTDKPDVSKLGVILSASVDRLIATGPVAEAGLFASALLKQYDKLVEYCREATRHEAASLQRWTQLFAECDLAEATQGLLATARHRYGDNVLRLPTSETPVVSVIIPVHGKFWYTYQCLTSIAAHPPEVSFEVILVDDGSMDETLFATSLVSGLRVVRKDNDRGFVATVNAGAAVARGEYLFLLNNDTQATAGWLDELCRTFDLDPSIGVVGSKLLFPNGHLQEVGGLIWRQANGYNVGRDENPDDPEYCYMRQADYVSGAALMLKRSTWDEVGGLSDEFKPAYYEDTDLCFKVRASGRKVVVQPYSRIIHHEGVSAGTDVQGTGMKRHQVINQQVFLKRWARVLANHAVSGSDPNKDEKYIQRRVLFIDESAPTPDQDAGSNAAFQHMLSLQRCGCEVHFVPSDNMARIPVYTEALERRGIRCYYAPYSWSVEEVLRRNTKRFDAVYLHRAANANKYLYMIRKMWPDVRIIYNVADLHYIRLERESALAGDAESEKIAADMKQHELAAAAAADVVITHSSFEAAILKAALPGTVVSVIPWTVEVLPTPLAFSERSGIVFVGSRNHPPNVDAVTWLIEEIMPLVWAVNPGIHLSVIGSGMTAGTFATVSDKVRIVGWVPDIATALHGYRLSVAPLRYGAGLKGKLLSSYAAGIPCVGSLITAEGASLPDTLNRCFAETAEDLARLILEMNDDSRANAEIARAGLAYIEKTCSVAAIDGLIARALDGPLMDGHAGAQGPYASTPH